MRGSGLFFLTILATELWLLSFPRQRDQRKRDQPGCKLFEEPVGRCPWCACDATRLHTDIRNREAKPQEAPHGSSEASARIRARSVELHPRYPAVLFDKHQHGYPLVPNTFYLIDVLLEFDTETKDYSFQATGGIGWNLNLGPVGQVAIEASVSIKATKKEEAFFEPFALIRADANGDARAYSGSISGKLTIGQFIMTVTYAFVEESSTLTFTFEFRSVKLTVGLP